MALTTEQQERIVIEATMNIEPSLKSEEALRYRRQIERDVRDIESIPGSRVDIPSELP